MSAALPRPALALVPLAVTLMLAACQGHPPAGEAARPRASTVADGAGACASLTGRALDGGRITESRFVAAGTERSRQPGVNREVGDPLPAHCVVRGRLDERTGVDGKPYHTGFELRLPSAFSGRLLYQGGGGNDGVINNAVGRNTGATGWGDHALARGFAAVSTDAGHQAPTPEFGLDPQARTEHAYRAHGRVAQVAKSLIASYYGRPTDRSYFIGCSGGGRQGMMFTQRYPGYFDGVIAVAPAMRVAEGATISAAWTVQKLGAAAPKGANGQPVLSRALSDTDLKLVGDAVTARCDAADGLVDGLVQKSCSFDPAVLRCTGAKADTCLAPAQVDALRDVMAGPRNSQGKALYFGWPWTPGMAAPDWRNWTMGTAAEGQPPNARHITLMAGALGYEFVTPPDPSLSTLNFNFDRDPARMLAFHREYGTADDVRLDGFRARNGKVMFFHGTADPIFSSIEMEDYMRRVHAQHGAARADDFARLYLVPGMNHCAGGPATDTFDGLAALVGWVEQGQAPDRVVARGSAGALADVQRPLCVWPKTAYYKGSGDVKSADSFECR